MCEPWDAEGDCDADPKKLSIIIKGGIGREIREKQKGSRCVAGWIYINLEENQTEYQTLCDLLPDSIMRSHSIRTSTEYSNNSLKTPTSR